MQLKVTVGIVRGDSGYPPAISHIFGATTSQLAQRKPRQTWHWDVSLERARLRLSEGSSCDLSMRNGPMKTFDIAHQFHLSRLTELVTIGWWLPRKVSVLKLRVQFSNEMSTRCPFLPKISIGRRRLSQKTCRGFRGGLRRGSSREHACQFLGSRSPAGVAVLRATSCGGWVRRRSRWASCRDARPPHLLLPPAS